MKTPLLALTGSLLMVAACSSSASSDATPEHELVDGTATADSGTDAVASAVDTLQQAVHGRRDTYPIRGASPIDLVKAYITAKYADDPDMAAGYTWTPDAAHIVTDEHAAGTLSTQAALAGALDAVSAWYAEAGERGAEAEKARLETIKGAIESASAGGAVFGFDGMEQNGCAIPTTFLLVLDPASGRGYGIDLTPCSEE